LHKLRTKHKFAFTI